MGREAALVQDDVILFVAESNPGVGPDDDGRVDLNGGDVGLSPDDISDEMLRYNVRTGELRRQNI